MRFKTKATKMCNNKLITPPREQINIKKERYGALDGLRAYAALGILLMHVQANMVVKPSAGYVTERLLTLLWLLHADKRGYDNAKRFLQKTLPAYIAVFCVVVHYRFDD